MEFSKEQLEEFKRIYAAQYNIQLNNNEANKQASQLVSLVAAIYDPLDK